MSTSELQIDLINKITTITDDLKLRELLRLLKFQSSESPYKTSKKDKMAIAEARKQIDDGKTRTAKEVKKEIKEWLNN